MERPSLQEKDEDPQSWERVSAQCGATCVRDAREACRAQAAPWGREAAVRWAAVRPPQTPGTASGCGMETSGRSRSPAAPGRGGDGRPLGAAPRRDLTSEPSATSLPATAETRPWSSRGNRAASTAVHPLHRADPLAAPCGPSREGRLQGSRGPFPGDLKRNGGRIREPSQSLLLPLCPSHCGTSAVLRDSPAGVTQTPLEAAEPLVTTPFSGPACCVSTYHQVGQRGPRDACRRQTCFLPPLSSSSLTSSEVRRGPHSLPASLLAQGAVTSH